MKKVGLVLLITVLALGGAAVGAWKLFTSGAFGFDNWVVDQVLRVAHTYIVPTVSYDDFEYDKGVVTMTGVTLTAPDGAEVVRAASMRVTLAETPTFGAGITIEAVELTDPSLRLLRDPEGGFRGLVPFVRGENIEQQDKVDEDVRASNAFQIRRIAIANGAIEYDQGDGAPPMRLGEINVDMDVAPVEGKGHRVYAIDFSVDRPGLISLAADAELDLGAFELTLESANLEADLAEEEALSALPPQIQELVRAYDAHGHLSLAARGRVDLGDPLASDLRTDLSLRGFNIASGGYRLPVQNAQVRAQLAGRVATFPKIDVAMLGGEVTITEGRFDLSDDAMPATASWSVSGLHLRQLLNLSQGEDAEEPKLAGVVASSGSVELAAADVPGSISGSGTLELREGRLSSVPFIQGLVDAVDAIQGKPSYKDKADIAFDLDGEGVRISEMEVVTTAVAARGKGTVFYDGRLDLLVNAGPMEKLQNLLGGVGDLLGGITDQLVKYDVEGTAAEPEVKVRPLGIGG